MLDTIVIRPLAIPFTSGKGFSESDGIVTCPDAATFQQVDMWVSRCHCSLKPLTALPHGKLLWRPEPAERQPQEAGSARVTAWHNTGIIGFRDGNLKELPDTVFGVGAGARTLDATNNKLTTFSPQLAQLSNLSRLVLTSNQIQEVPAAVLQLQFLKVLLLDSNMLTELPAGIGHLLRLERLSVAHNNLAALPASLGQLQKLQVLQLSSNKLIELPAQLGTCSQLEDLDVSDNYLQSLPPELGSLQRLKAINATSNRLQTVPPAILQDCSSLQTLLLHVNPISAEALQEIDGYEHIEQRRRSKYDKKIHGGAHVGAMDTGVDAN